LKSDAEIREAVLGRWNSLTKPPRSLGRLEELVLQYALARGTEMPAIERKAMYIFCGDHGVTSEGVSAYPSEVTAQMVLNFLSGGAAVSVLCRHYGIEPVIVDAGVAGDPAPGVVNRKIAGGTRNFCTGPAMTRAEAEAAIEAGRALAAEAAGRFDVAGTGEMGIGNTTSASALLCAFARIPASEATGRGAGLDDDGIRRKADAIERALALHRPDPGDPVGVLASLGGFEIAMMAGFHLGSAAHRLPVVVDGFISGAAAMAALTIDPGIRPFLFFSHLSAERGHARLLEHARAEPILDLEMRLGEGSAAAIAIGLIETALALYRDMATFSSACISGRKEE